MEGACRGGGGAAMTIGAYSVFLSDLEIPASARTSAMSARIFSRSCSAVDEAGTTMISVRGFSLDRLLCGTRVGAGTGLGGCG